MNHARFWLWLSVVLGGLGFGVLVASRDSSKLADPEPARSGPAKVYIEKLQDGTFCVISTYYSSVAMSCDFTCRDILNEGGACQ